MAGTSHRILTWQLRVPLPERPKYKTVILTFDDASKSNFSNVAPVLKKYGFGAAFFIYRFNDKWRAKHESLKRNSQNNADGRIRHRNGFYSKNDY